MLGYVVVVVAAAAVGTLHSSAVGPVDDTEKVVVDSSANRRSSSSCPFVSLERFKSILSRTLKTPPPRTRGGFHLSRRREQKARENKTAPRRRWGAWLFLLSRRFARGGGHESLFPN